jgi:hypothetical protein
MSVISILWLIVLGLSMLFTTFLLVISLKRNYQTGQLVRKQLADKINQLPMGKMLEKHGIEPSSFLHKVSLTDIESEIRLCHSCNKTVECDKALRNEEIKDEAMTFCPNSAAMINHQSLC